MVDWITVGVVLLIIGWVWGSVEIIKETGELGFAILWPFAMVIFLIAWPIDKMIRYLDDRKARKTS